jgi:hypothetical protein
MIQTEHNNGAVIGVGRFRWRGRMEFQDGKPFGKASERTERDGSYDRRLPDTACKHFPLSISLVSPLEVSVRPHAECHQVRRAGTEFVE